MDFVTEIKNLGYSQVKFGKHVGVDRSTVGRWKLDRPRLVTVLIESMKRVKVLEQEVADYQATVRVLQKNAEKKEVV